MVPKVYKQFKLDEDTADPGHLQIARFLERLIHTDVLKENERLPSTLELVDLWGANITRIQRAMDLLVANGLLQRSPRRGTFVTSRRARPSVGILMGPDLLPGEPQFYRLLAADLKLEIKSKGLVPRLYDSFNGSRAPYGGGSHEDIHYDLRHRSFVGFTAVGVPRKALSLEEDKLQIGESKFPYASFSTPAPDIDVHVDYQHFVSTAVDSLISRGCRTFAYFPPSISPPYKAHLKSFTDSMKAAGIPAKAYKVVKDLNKGITHPQSVGLERSAYQRTMALLQRWNKSQFSPDAFIISDDIAARGIIAAVNAAGDSASEFVVQSNLNTEHFYVLPAIRYLVSTAEIARDLVQRLTLRMTNSPHASEPEMVRGTLTDAYR